MVEKKIEVINKLGLHARAAAKLVKLASSFESDIQLCREDESFDKKTANAKSIMGVMMLAASKGTYLTLNAEGPDMLEAIDKIDALFQDYFEEDE